MTATTVLVSAFAMAAQADEVHVLNWKGYGADEPWAIEAFEKATGHKVINDFFNSEQEMLTKLRTNPGLYDVVMINAAFNDQATAEKLIQPIDVSKIPNAADLSPDKSGSPLLNHDGKVFGVPWVWGLTALAINEKSFPTPPTSISVMWDEAHKGRVVLRDDALEAVQFGAIATGQNINDIKDLDAVKAKLTSLMPQIRTFWSSENDWNQMVASNQIDVGTYWSGSADRAKTQFKLPVSLVIPQEGADDVAAGCGDGIALSRAGRNVGRIGLRSAERGDRDRQDGVVQTAGVDGAGARAGGSARRRAGTGRSADCGRRTTGPAGRGGAPRRPRNRVADGSSSICNSTGSPGVSGSRRCAGGTADGAATGPGRPPERGHQHAVGDQVEPGIRRSPRTRSPGHRRNFRTPANSSTSSVPVDRNRHRQHHRPDHLGIAVEAVGEAEPTAADIEAPLGRRRDGAVGSRAPSSVSEMQCAQWCRAAATRCRRTAVTVLASSRTSTRTGGRFRMPVSSPPRKWSKNSAWTCSAASE